MAQTLRVNFAGAPAPILKQLFGEAKHSANILEALAHFQGYAHEKEVFHYLNTDAEGNWITEKNSKGEDVVAVSLVNLRKQLTTMVLTSQIKRLGERSAQYAELDFEGEVESDEDETEAEEAAE